MGERGFLSGDLLIEAVLVAPDGGFKALQVGVPSASLLAQAFLAISERQRLLMQELADARVIHHGLDPVGQRFGTGDGGYCAFLGRMAREKGPHVAVDVARAAGIAIRLGGAPHWRDHEYFDRELRARVALPGVSAVGEVGGARKRELLADACALLFPARLGRAVRPRDDRGDAVGDTGVGLRARLGARDRRAWRDRLHLPRRRRDGVAAAGDSHVQSRGAADGAHSSASAAARMVRDYVAVYETLQAWVGDVRVAETVA